MRLWLSAPTRNGGQLPYKSQKSCCFLEICCSLCGDFEADTVEAAFAQILLAAKARPIRKKTELQVTVNGWLERSVLTVFSISRNALAGRPYQCGGLCESLAWSPRALDDLLSEPDMPKLNLIAGSDAGCPLFNYFPHSRFGRGPIISSNSPPLTRSECANQGFSRGFPLRKAF